MEVYVSSQEESRGIPNPIEISTRKLLVSVLVTVNSIAERDFELLGRLIREKPNANMVTCDVIIINKTNETLERRDQLSPEITVIIAK